MPISHAAFKAIRQSAKRRARNLSVRAGLKRSAKAVRKAIVAKDKAKAEAALKSGIRLIDRAYAKGVIKLNTAARMKSRLSRAVAKT